MRAVKEVVGRQLLKKNWADGGSATKNKGSCRKTTIEEEFGLMKNQ
jgi:hypothetical protein